MRRTALLVVAFAFVVSVSAVALTAEEPETLTGSFVWNNENRTGDLEAVFTPTADGKWSVAFHFMWEDEAQVFKGTAEGNLSEGELKGEVRPESQKRAFTFTGSFKDGKFTGTHAVIREEGPRDTGTMTLTR